MRALLDELKEKIIQECQLEDTAPGDIADEAEFFGAGLGLDSVDLLVLVAMLDRDYGIMVRDRETGERVFATLTTLAEYIQAHRAR